MPGNTKKGEETIKNIPTEINITLENLTKIYFWHLSVLHGQGVGGGSDTMGGGGVVDACSVNHCLLYPICGTYKDLLPDFFHGLRQPSLPGNRGSGAQARLTQS